jgi:hypothetical protein
MDRIESAAKEADLHAAAARGMAQAVKTVITAALLMGTSGNDNFRSALFFIPSPLLPSSSLRLIPGFAHRQKR